MDHGTIPFLPYNMLCVPCNMPCLPYNIPCLPCNIPCLPCSMPCLPWRLPLIRGGGRCIRPIVARVTWDFACVFVCFGSGILFVSLEKVFILALEGTRFPSLLTPQTERSAALQYAMTMPIPCLPCNMPCLPCNMPFLPCSHACPANMPALPICRRVAGGMGGFAGFRRVWVGLRGFGRLNSDSG